MTRVINGILSFLKVILLLVCFVLSFFIIINMYRRLEKNIIEAIPNFIPFVLLFILFAINMIFRQKSVNKCLFYNITCCLVFGMILFAAYRTFFDRNMVVMIRLGYDINFNYFADVIAPMRAMLYILCVCNVLLMIEGIDFSKLLGVKEESVEEPKKEEVPVKKTTKKKVAPAK